MQQQQPQTTPQVSPQAAAYNGSSPAAYWLQFLQSRIAPTIGGQQQTRMHRNEVNSILTTVSQMKANGSANTDPDFPRLLEALQQYASLTGSASATHQAPVATPAVQFTPEQVEKLRLQISAFKHVQRGIPIPSELAALFGVQVPDKRPTPAPTNGQYANVRTVQSVSGHAQLVPSQMPIGLDPIALAAERETRIRSRVAVRIAELENLCANMPPDAAPVTHASLGRTRQETSVVAGDVSHLSSDKIRALIELKSLQMLDRQKKMRAEILTGMKKATTLQTAVSRLDYRRTKKPSVREIRLTEKMERQQRMERDKKEKMKQTEHLNVIIQHGREMITNRKQMQQKQMKLGRAVMNWHNTVEKEEQKKQERLTKERIRALKADDEDAYLKLIDKQKDTRLTHLLAQTDTYLSSLTALVEAQKDGVRLLENNSAPAAPVAVSDTPGVEEEDGNKIDYYNIAHRIQEKVTKQPTILVGGTLKEYQIKGLEWMASLYNNKLNGILADEMGLGKTIQTISLITFLMESKNQNGPFLVIVPLSTMTNWTLEFEKWAPSVVKIAYKGNPNQRRDIQMKEMRHGTFNVLLTTYEYVIKDKGFLSKFKWIYTIIDEGHRMKNAASKLSITLTQSYSSRFRIILTGTPLQNSLPELWALLNFVLPKVFNSVKSFDDWFNTPFANTGEKIDLNEEEQLLIISRLHKVLRPFLLRRLKKEVEKDLPDKVERVIKTRMSALQLKLYSQIRKSGAFMINTTDSGGGKKGSSIRNVNNTIMQLRKVCNHPFVYNEVEDNLNPTHATNEMIMRVSGKFELLDRILPKFFSTGHRCLIFFQMTAVMDIMEDFLRWKKLKYLRLDGSTKAEDRSALLKLFNAPDSEYSVFILSTRAGGLGLNLQTADTVIIFDSDWNPHQDLQAQDRAHRIGQTKEVRIFRLITANSVEETILARAQFKLDIDGKVIQAGKFDNKSTNEERDQFLRSLFDTNEEELNDLQDVDDDDELNEIISRSDAELEQFRQDDIKRGKHDSEWWRKLGQTGPVSRLITIGELPEIYLHDSIPEPEKSEVELGRGQRSREEIKYDDGMGDDEWARQIDKQAELEEMESGKKNSTSPKKKAAPVIVESEDDDEDGITSDKRPREVVESPTKSSIESEEEMDKPLAKKIKMSSPKVKPASSAVADSLDPMSRAIIQRTLLAGYNAVAECKDSQGRQRCELFLELPSREEYAEYYDVIEKPISMKQIKDRIYGNRYQSVDNFMRDFHLMFNNAFKFNQEGSSVHQDAFALKQEHTSQKKKMPGIQASSSGSRGYSSNQSSNRSRSGSSGGSGYNSEGNHYNTPGGINASGGSSYHVSNSNGSYYHSYDNVSSYYNDGRGSYTYTSGSSPGCK